MPARPGCARPARGSRSSYAASNALAKQIEAGAPADLFVSADLDWMDYAASKRLIQPESRVSLLGNSLVLIAPKGSTAAGRRSSPDSISPSILGGNRLAMGHVDAVPAGKYGKAALEHLGAWAGVKDKIAQAENVRAALLLVSRGEAPLGIVYKTDAVSDPNVNIVATFPEESHPPIVYPVALTKDSSNPDAAAFLAFLRSDKAKPFFEKQGFTFVEQGGLRLVIDWLSPEEWTAVRLSLKVAFVGDDGKPHSRHRHRVPAGARALLGAAGLDVLVHLPLGSAAGRRRLVSAASVSAGAAPSAPSWPSSSASCSRSAGRARRSPAPSWAFRCWCAPSACPSQPSTASSRMRRARSALIRSGCSPW